MFTQDFPADDLAQLLDHLHDVHIPTYLYRGQTKDYGSIIPSHFRNQSLEMRDGFAIMGGTYSRPNIGDAHKFAIMNVLIKEYGKRIGNYISQQYMCSSEVVDVSEHPDVAGFFASRRYPFGNSVFDPDSLGVIYRFDSREINAAGGKFSPKRNQSYRTGRLKDGGFSGQEFSVYLERDQQNGWSAKDFYYSPHELERPVPELMDAYLVTHAQALSFTDISDLTGHANLTDRAEAFVRDLMSDKDQRQGFRARTQMGGVITPRYLWHCKIPQPEPAPSLPHTDKAPWTRRNRFGNTLWGEGLVGVEDLYGCFGMSAFYFRHKGDTPDVDRSIFWPSWYYDDTFYYLWMLATIANDDGKPGRVDPAEVIDIGFPENRPDTE